jgi:hypothetical protein
VEDEPCILGISILPDNARRDSIQYLTIILGKAFVQK